MTYSALQSDIAAYLHRGDLTDQIPTFIRTAEAFLFRELFVKELMTTATLTTTGEYADLPADFAAVSKVTADYGGTTYNLDYRSEPVNTTVTVMSSYALENGQIRVMGASTGTVVTLYYIPKITALSDTNTTNWLLDNASDLYLYASCLEGARFVRNAQMVQELTALSTAALDAVKRYIERRGQPSTGSMQIRVRRG